MYRSERLLRAAAGHLKNKLAQKADGRNQPSHRYFSIRGV
jgi:hypothetical protein